MTNLPTRRRFTTVFKAQVVTQILRDDKTLAQIAAEHSAHPNQLSQGQATVLGAMPALFEKDESAQGAESALDRALSGAVPSICNSDQGSHFTSPQYLERLRAKEVQISMDGKSAWMAKAMSRTQCKLFSMPQCSRTAPRSCLALAGRLERK